MQTHDLIDPTPRPDDRPARDDPAHAPWGVREITFALLIAIGILGLVQLVILGVVVALDLPRADITSSARGAALVAVGQGVIDILVVLAAWWLSIGRFHLSGRAWSLRRERPINIGGCVLALVGAYASLLLYSGIVNALGLDRLKPGQNLPNGLFEYRGVVPLTVILVVIIAPFTEEMFFRAFIFNGLRRQAGVYGAALVAGALWASIHGSLGLVIPITMIGFIFAVLAARTGSLWNAILVHLVFNLVSVTAQIATGTVLQ